MSSPRRPRTARTLHSLATGVIEASLGACAQIVGPITNGSAEYLSWLVHETRGYSATD